MDRSLSALRDEIKNRARIYHHLYRELSAELGEEKAISVLKRAIYRRGQEKGRQLARKIGGQDPRKLADAFVEGKEGVDVFGHQIVRVDDREVLLRLNECPLVEAWKEMGLQPEQIRTMCDLACQVDFGKFEAAGYRLRFECRIADGGSSCDLLASRPAPGI
ncbi:MAG: L-2-amino-thiazoline-4-carboxylic acid hydrolase [Acidobacteriota bacterium]